VLDALAKKGYIRRTPLLSRGIELTDYVEAGTRAEIQSVPIIGRVAAGEPILAVENVEGTLAVDRTFLPSEGVFALLVNGDSMKNAGILHGDYVLARQQNVAEKGDIVVAIVGEEATVKRYIPSFNRVTLMPENEAYDPIVVDHRSPAFQIAGKVIGLMRRLQ
jgi:repressor LexA